MEIKYTKIKIYINIDRTKQRQKLHISIFSPEISLTGPRKCKTIHEFGSEGSFILDRIEQILCNFQHQNE